METRQTCLKLEIPHATDPIFVKGTWFQSHFDLSITDGLNAWLCNASEEQVKDRAALWDQPVTEYIKLAERYLGFQQPGCVYGFTDAADGCKRLSWTFEKEGTKLEWRWKCGPAPNSKKVPAGILDFLMDANIRLSFLGVLNSKKSKLRELQDKLSKQAVMGDLQQEEEESTDETESFDEGTDDDKSEEEPAKDITSTSIGVPASRARGRKRISRK
ncbi:DNA repair protein XRCC4 [Citrus sinensis]|nr:DNA repair protein XRCC4 [Citrus sinensis]